MTLGVIILWSRRIADETPGAFYANQYHNQDNTHAHYISTGPEPGSRPEGKWMHSSLGWVPRGTISGTGKYLREQNPNIQLVGVDVKGSVYYDFESQARSSMPIRTR